MTTAETGIEDPLAPVREGLLERARQDGRRLLAEARATADAALARAEQEASGIRAEARAQGEADAAVVLASERMRVRRQARSVVLRAERDAYLGLRAEVHASLAGWRDGAGHQRIGDRLAARARDLLGEGAVITEDASGGVVGEVAGRRVVLSLDAIADRVLDARNLDLAGLWTP